MDVISKEIKLVSGVPQGSNLAPLLYIIFINDVLNCIKNSEFLLYIDDMKLYKSIENLDDVHLFKEDIQNIINLNNDNGLKFNISKCKIMIFKEKYSSLNIDTHYVLEGEVVERVSILKDLGIFFQENMNFATHINFVTSKAKKRLYLLKKKLQSFSRTESLNLMYNAHIKSILMYGSVIWSPTVRNLIYDIEKIQHQYFRIYASIKKILFDYREHNYHELAKSSDMITLESARNISEIKFLYNILNNNIDEIEILAGIDFSVPVIKLRNRNILQKILFTVPFELRDSRHKSSIFSMSQTYNSISDKVDIFDPSMLRFFKTVKENLRKLE